MKRAIAVLSITIGLVVMAVPTIAVDAVPYGTATTILAEDGTEIHCVFDVTLDADGNVTGFEFTDCPAPATPPSEADSIVPEIVGLTEGDALAALAAAGFVPQRVEASDGDVPAGTVVSQDPYAGADAAAGSTVNFVVSIGSDDTSGDDTSGDDTAVVPAQSLDDLKVGDSFVNFGYDAGHTTITLERVVSGIKTSRYSKPDRGMTTLAVFFSFVAGPDGGRTNLVSAFSPDGTEYDYFYGAEGKYEQGWDYEDIRPGKTVQGWQVFEVPDKGKVEVVMDGYDEYGDDIFATWVVEP